MNPRTAHIPVFFTTCDYDPADPPSPQSRKLTLRVTPGETAVFQARSATGP